MDRPTLIPDDTPRIQLGNALDNLLRATRDHVLKACIREIDRAEANISAVADVHVVGYRAGFREAKRQITCALAEMMNTP